MAKTKDAEKKVSPAAIRGKSQHWVAPSYEAHLMFACWGIYIYINICIHTHIYIEIYIYNVRVRVCTYRHIYTYIHTYVQCKIQNLTILGPLLNS